MLNDHDMILGLFSRFSPLEKYTLSRDKVRGIMNEVLKKHPEYSSRFLLEGNEPNDQVNFALDVISQCWWIPDTDAPADRFKVMWSLVERAREVMGTMTPEEAKACEAAGSKIEDLMRVDREEKPDDIWYNSISATGTDEEVSHGNGERTPGFEDRGDHISEDLEEVD